MFQYVATADAQSESKNIVRSIYIKTRDNVSQSSVHGTTVRYSESLHTTKHQLSYYKMYARLAILAMALAICHAFPQHGYVNFGRGNQGGYQTGYQSGYQRNYGGQSIQIAHAPVLTKVAALPVVHKVAALPVLQKVVAAPVEHYAPPHYQYEYAVNDEHTGDIKSQHEERDGDNTRGYYTLHEPDGTILTVHYTVDKDSGFIANVERTGHAAHPQQVAHKTVLKPVVPILKHY